MLKIQFSVVGRACYCLFVPKQAYDVNWLSKFSALDTLARVNVSKLETSVQLARYYRWIFHVLSSVVRKS
jgi:hypothetical protein